MVPNPYESPREVSVVRERRVGSPLADFITDAVVLMAAATGAAIVSAVALFFVAGILNRLSS